MQRLESCIELDTLIGTLFKLVCSITRVITHIGQVKSNMDALKRSNCQVLEIPPNHVLLDRLTIESSQA